MTFRGHFDGKVLIPEEPVSLPVGQVLEVSVKPLGTSGEAIPPLARIAQLADKYPANPDLPNDGAAEHDHYLYGRPKQEP